MFYLTDMRLSVCLCFFFASVIAYNLDRALEIAGPNAPEIVRARSLAVSDEEAECLEFLINNMPPNDLRNLTAGFIITNVRLALKARYANQWALDVPWDIFLNNVLPYANLAENRDFWRRPFNLKFAPLVENAKSIAEATLIMNRESWKIVDPPIIFVAAPPDELNQYSPFEVMNAHNASCTGLSIFLVDACRSVGIPARVAGVPHWNNPQCQSDADAACGNHDWVEVWADGGWTFVDQDTNNALNTSWFFPGSTQWQVPHNLNHSIYAASWNMTGAHFPMVWDWNNHDIPGVDVTTYYLNWPNKSVSESLKPNQRDTVAAFPQTSKHSPLLPNTINS